MKRSSIVIGILGLSLLVETYFYLDEHEQYEALKKYTLLKDDDPLVKAALVADHARNGGTIELTNKSHYKQDLVLQRHPCVRLVLKPGGMGGSSIYCFKDESGKEIVAEYQEGQ